MRGDFVPRKWLTRFNAASTKARRPWQRYFDRTFRFRIYLDRAFLFVGFLCSSYFCLFRFRIISVLISIKCFPSLGFLYLSYFGHFPFPHRFRTTMTVIFSPSRNRLYPDLHDFVFCFGFGQNPNQNKFFLSCSGILTCQNKKFLFWFLFWQNQNKIVQVSLYSLPFPLYGNGNGKVPTLAARNRHPLTRNRAASNFVTIWPEFLLCWGLLWMIWWE